MILSEQSSIVVTDGLFTLVVRYQKSTISIFTFIRKQLSVFQSRNLDHNKNRRENVGGVLLARSFLINLYIFRATQVLPTITSDKAKRNPAENSFCSVLKKEV